VVGASRGGGGGKGANIVSSTETPAGRTTKTVACSLCTVTFATTAFARDVLTDAPAGRGPPIGLPIGTVVVRASRCIESRALPLFPTGELPPPPPPPPSVINLFPPSRESGASSNSESEPLSSS
jgi:hypothetical protein